MPDFGLDIDAGILAFNPLVFVLPRRLGLLEWILVTQLIWLGVMGVYGMVLKHLITSPRDSVLVFHRIFWRIFLRPNALPTLEAYDDPRTMADFDVDDVAVTDALDPAAEGFGGTYRGGADPSAHTAGGTLSGSMSGSMSGASASLSDSLLDDVIPPEPDAIMGAGDEPLEALITVKLVPRSPDPGLAGIHGSVVTINVASGGEDGLANRQVLQSLCQALAIETYQITVLKGHMKPEKSIRITGVTLEQVQTALMNR